MMKYVALHLVTRRERRLLADVDKDELKDSATISRIVLVG